MNALAGKVAVITGGTRGLGLAMAEAFAREGAAVVVAGRDEGTVAEVVARLRAAGHQADGLPCDVSDPGQVRALAAHAIAACGKFDVWVNNAGVAGPYGPTVDIAPERFLQVINTNILGAYHGSMAALSHLLPRNDGKLINVLGRGDKKPAPMQNAYGASKSWLRSFTLALAEEHKDTGVGIYAFQPGLVDTRLLRTVDVVAGHEDRLSVFPTVIRMWANPPAVPAEKAVWLASAATDGKTGLVVRAAGKGRLATGAAREGLRRLARRPAEPVVVEMTSIPPVGPQPADQTANEMPGPKRRTDPADLVQRDLRPDEDAVFGQWLDTGNRMEPDQACARIAWLTTERLELVTPGEGGLTTLYRDPADGRLWELHHPFDTLPRRGPPHLVLVDPTDARRRYGPQAVE